MQKDIETEADPCKRPFNDFYRATIEDGHTQSKILEVLIANAQTMVAVSRYPILGHVQANGLGILIPLSTSDVTIPFCPNYQRPIDLDSTSHLLPPFRPTLPKNKDCARADATNCLPRCQSICHLASTLPRRQSSQNHLSRFLCRHCPREYF